MLLSYSMQLSDDCTLPRNSMSQCLGDVCLFLFVYFFPGIYTSVAHMWFLEACINKWALFWSAPVRIVNVIRRIPAKEEMGFVQQHLDAWLQASLFLLGFAATFHNFISIKADAICRFQLHSPLLSGDYVSAEGLDWPPAQEICNIDYISPL